MATVAVLATAAPAAAQSGPNACAPPQSGGTFPTIDGHIINSTTKAIDDVGWQGSNVQNIQMIASATALTDSRLFMLAKTDGQNLTGFYLGGVIDNATPDPNDLIILTLEWRNGEVQSESWKIVFQPILASDLGATNTNRHLDHLAAGGGQSLWYIAGQNVQDPASWTGVVGTADTTGSTWMGSASNFAYETNPGTWSFELFIPVPPNFAFSSPTTGLDLSNAVGNQFKLFADILSYDESGPNSGNYEEYPWPGGLSVTPNSGNAAVAPVPPYAQWGVVSVAPTRGPACGVVTMESSDIGTPGTPPSDQWNIPDCGTSTTPAVNDTFVATPHSAYPNTIPVQAQFQYETWGLGGQQTNGPQPIPNGTVSAAILPGTTTTITTPAWGISPSLACTLNPDPGNDHPCLIVSLDAGAGSPLQAFLPPARQRNMQWAPMSQLDGAAAIRAATSAGGQVLLKTRLSRVSQGKFGTAFRKYPPPRCSVMDPAYGTRVCCNPERPCPPVPSNYETLEYEVNGYMRTSDYFVAGGKKFYKTKYYSGFQYFLEHRYNPGDLANGGAQGVYWSLGLKGAGFTQLGTDGQLPGLDQGPVTHQEFLVTVPPGAGASAPVTVGAVASNSPQPNPTPIPPCNCRDAIGAVAPAGGALAAAGSLLGLVALRRRRRRGHA